MSPERKRQVQLLLLHSEHGAAEATRGLPGRAEPGPAQPPRQCKGQGHPRSLQCRTAELQGQPGTGGAASSALTSWTLLQGGFI